MESLPPAAAPPAGGRAIRTIIPFVRRDHRTAAGAPPGAEWHDVSDGPDAYWRLMRDLWQPGADLLIIEHDVVCRPDVVESFAACPEPWCAFPYADMCHWECMEAWANTLGCTRFRSELIAACPDALASIPEGRRHWTNVCDEIAGNKIAGVDQPTLRPGSMRAAGFGHHWHFPAVEHFHVMQMEAQG